jgi:metal-sulfur cluster biosynthetic enzyme
LKEDRLSGNGTPAGPCRAEIDARLDEVYDPELDESILRLGFVDDVQIDGPDVTVTYRLPTFWCAPNFAYMMAADVRDAVRRVAGVRSVRVLLRDHCADATINAGINQGRSFREAFPDEALDDLDALRQKFLAKSFLARQEQLIRRVQQAGLSDAQLVEVRIADVQPCGEDVLVYPRRTAGIVHQASAPGARGVAREPAAVHVRRAAGELTKYLRKRTLLGLPQHPDAYLFTDLEGAPLSAETLPAYLRHSRLVRVSIAFNTSLCEGLLRTRYATAGAPQHDIAGPTDRLLPVESLERRSTP